MTREKTNSVTHLVKIIANEVFDERKEELQNTVTVDVTHQLEDIVSNLQNAGEMD